MSARLRVLRGLMLTLSLSTWSACAQPPSAGEAQLLVSSSALPPPDSAAWQTVPLPDNSKRSRPGRPGATTWYRITLQLAKTDLSRPPLAVYVPYLRYGGRIFLNGRLLARIPEPEQGTSVRWERPHWVPVPVDWVHAGTNLLHVRAAVDYIRHSLEFPRLSLGAQADLLPAYERRYFWVRTVPQLTVLTCTLASPFALTIWLWRRKDVLYGLLGLALLFWGIRTLTFSLEWMPLARWFEWQVVYYAATGGFVTMFALFALRFARVRSPRLAFMLGLYWATGPLCILLSPSRTANGLLDRFWVGGLIPVALAVFIVVIKATWRDGSRQTWVLLGALALPMLAGVHDYLVAWNELFLIAPEWSSQRIYLLHHAANLALLVTAGLLTARFVRALNAVEELNLTLENRVAERERRLVEQFDEIARLERRQATEEERQRIMRDMHDGLGSELFATLSRLERGCTVQEELVGALRRCIDEMRLVLDSLTPVDEAFETALGNFRYRWEARLSASGVDSSWSLDPGESTIELSRRTRLQILRVIQEALTNVLKHANARRVHVSVVGAGESVLCEVFDDGRGFDPSAARAGRGLVNMHARALRVKATLTITSDQRGTAIKLELGAGARDSVPSSAQFHGGERRQSFFS